MAKLAARQHGVVARRQLLEIGCSSAAIGRRQDAGRLHGVHRGVYAVGHPAIGHRGRWMAAVLACGPGAVLSHRSAGALWGLRPSARSGIDVIAASRGPHGRDHIAVHRPRNLDPADRARRDGIPVTSVARTLRDLAGVVPARALERAVEEAERLRLFDLRGVERVLARSPTQRGSRALRTLVAAQLGEPPATRSELERRFLDLCRGGSLPPPAVNSIVEGMEVDAAWLDARLVVELDSRAYHRTTAAFERDRARDTVLQVAGHRVVRVTDLRLRREPRAVASDLRKLLGLARAA